MPALQIDFEDGFDGETVVVRAGGRELWRGERLQTSLASGVAAIAHVDVPEGDEVEVAVPTRGLAATRRVQAPFLRASLAGEQLVLEESEELPLHL